MPNWFKRRGALDNFRDYVMPALAGVRCRYLEIGSWGGNSLIWTFENILTHRKSSAIVVDPWLSVKKYRQETVDKLYKQTMQRLEPYKHRCTVFRQPSSVWLRHHDYPLHSFDFIYIDGDHTDLLVMDDAVLCWPLLKIGGFMIFDDYGSRRRDQHHVRHAVSAFMSVYGRGYAETLFTNYQYGIRKISDVTMLAFNQQDKRRKPGIVIQPEIHPSCAQLT